MSTAIANTKTNEQLLAAKQTLKTRIDKLMPQIEASVPRGVTPDSLVRFFFNAINANPDLLTCTPNSLADCLVRAASRGLEISDGMLGDCYLIPFANRKAKTSEAQLIVGYKGVKKLVRNSGQGIVVMGHARKGDLFTDNGQLAAPTHSKALDPQRLTYPITHAWACMVFRNGLTVSHVMTLEEVLAHRKAYVQPSNYANASQPWHEDNPAFARMAEKTAVRQLASRGDLPLSADDKTMLATDEALIAVANTVDHASIEVPREQIADQTPVEPEPTITDVELEEAVAECTTPLSCDDMSSRLRRHYPGSRQEIWDAFEAKREILINSNPACEEEPP